MDNDIYSMSDALEKILEIKIYIWISEPTNVAKDLVMGKNLVYLS